MPKLRNVNKVLEEDDLRGAMDILVKAKEYCKVGKILELMDLLCPEDTLHWTSHDGRKQKR